MTKEGFHVRRQAPLFRVLLLSNTYCLPDACTRDVVDAVPYGMLAGGGWLRFAGLRDESPVAAPGSPLALRAVPPPGGGYGLSLPRLSDHAAERYSRRFDKGGEAEASFR